MEVLNTMTKIMDNVRTHGGIALHGVMGANLSVALWRTLARDSTKTLDARPAPKRSGPLCDNTGHGKQLPNDNPV